MGAEGSGPPDFVCVAISVQADVCVVGFDNQLWFCERLELLRGFFDYLEFRVHLSV